MSTIATRATPEIRAALDWIEQSPLVERAHESERTAGDSTERIGVVVLEDGIERIPPSVCRAIGEGDFGIDMIERFEGHLEVVLR